MALSWRNLPGALKAAIGVGKQTLGDPGQSDPSPGAAARAPRPTVRRPERRGADSLDEAKAALLAKWDVRNGTLARSTALARRAGVLGRL